MTVMEALTKLVVGMSRFGDHLLSRKVSGIIIAALAFAGGAGLAHTLKREPASPPAVSTSTSCGAPDLAEVSISDTPVDKAEEEDFVLHTGRYANYVYGYSVRIPDGMVGLGAMPPAPPHGFGIDLDNSRSTEWIRGPEFPKSYVYVDGSYNSLEWKRLDDAVNSNLSFLREKGENVRVQARIRTQLGAASALRVVATYEEGGEEMVSDVVIAFRSEYNGEASVVYTLALNTPQSKYLRDREVLKALMKDWCLQPIE